MKRFYSKLYTSAKTNLFLKNRCPAYLINKDAPIGLVVIQEWWGLNLSIIHTTDKIAAQGFTCLTPDLFRGKVAKDTEEAGHLLSGLDWDSAVEDIDAAAEHLHSLGCKKVGVIGFCMGGALSIAAITTSKHIHAAAPFYGVCDLNKFQIKNANGPIYGQFGLKDDMKGFSSPDDAQRLVDAGKSANKDVKVKMWENVGHAFMNQDRPETYNQKVADEAIQEITKFFKGI